MRVKVLVLILSILVVSCGTKDKNAELKKLKSEYEALGLKIKNLEKEISSSGKSNDNERVFQVNADELKLKPFNHYIEVQGKVDGEENVTVTSKTPGVITNIYVKEGDAVKKGQILAMLDNGVLVQTLSELKTSQAYINELYEKQKKLWDQKIGSEIQYLSAKNNKEGIDKKLKTFEEQIDMYNITSPITGTIEEIPVKVGQSLAPGFTAFRIVNFSTVKITAEVSESYSVKIHTGDVVNISFPDNNEKITAKISFSSKYINPVNRTFLVEAKLEPGNIEFRANMIAILEIVDYSIKEAIVIPVNTIQADEKGKYVYIMENIENKTIARKRMITTGRSYNGEVEILNGLKAGEKILTTGFQNLEDGVKISI
jgi:membrane fusion protein, multidrug efflux system